MDRPGWDRQHGEAIRDAGTLGVCFLTAVVLGVG